MNANAQTTPAEAHVDRPLPPLPEPGQPAKQVLAALIAWLGGTGPAIESLAGSLHDVLEVVDYDEGNSEPYEDFEVFLNGRAAALQAAYRDLREDEARVRQVNDAIVRHGYDKASAGLGARRMAEYDARSEAAQKRRG